MNFVLWVLWPVFSLTLIGFVTLGRTREMHRFDTFMTMVTVYWYLSYGAWATINMYDLIYTDEQACKKWLASNINELNYEAVVVFGIFPAFFVIFITGMLIIAAPFILLMFYRNR